VIIPGIKRCPGVYPPSDDTYLLADAVEQRVSKGDSFLEVGCGSGYVSIVAALLGANVDAVDMNPRAVECTLRNAELNGVRVNAWVSDLFSNVKGAYDWIVMNPPYLPADERAPDTALDGGFSGAEISLRFIKDVGEHLAEGGRFLLLMSSITAAEPLRLARRLGYRLRTVARKRFFMEELFVVEGWKNAD